MYYSGREKGEMRSTFTRDGLNFTEEGECLPAGEAGAPDERGLVHLAPLRLPDGRLRVYYDAQAPAPAWLRVVDVIWQTTSAVSEDGLHFTREPGHRLDRTQLNRQRNLRSRGVRFWYTWSVCPQYREGRYYLYTTALCLPQGKSGIWRATSTDGIHFVMDSEPSLCADDLGGQGVPEDPYVLCTPEGERLYYWVRDRGTMVAFRPWDEEPEPDGTR